MNLLKKIDARRERAAHVNKLITSIASYGRKFFWSAEYARCAHIEVDALGLVWFHDEHTGARIYTHYIPFRRTWSGFSHRGTLLGLVELMRDYIVTGKRIPMHFIAPMSINYDAWGYGRVAAYELHVAAARNPAVTTSH